MSIRVRCGSCNKEVIVPDSAAQERILCPDCRQPVARVEPGDVSRSQVEEELQAIYDGMADGLLLADIETLRLLRANPAACQMFGYSGEEISRLSVKDLHPPEDVSGVLDHFRFLLRERIGQIRDIRFVRKDGSVFCADVRSSRLRYQGRDCVIGFFRDNADWKSVEWARQEAELALGQEQDLLRRLLELAERDRELLAFEIHDGLAQQLAAAKMQFESSTRLREANPEQARTAFDDGLGLLREGIQEARRLMTGLRPPVLDAFGIVAAIEHLVLQHQGPEGPEIEFADVRFERLARPLENALFRVVQESLTNASKHSRSPKVRVELADDGQKVWAVVRDWGVGFDPDRIEEGHFGLQGIRERARLFHGHATIESAPGQGTTIRVELPLVARGEE